MSTKTTVADVGPLALERQVCFELAVTSRAVLAVHRALLGPRGVTHPHYLVMLALWGHPRSSPEPLSVQQVVAARQLVSATMSPMLERLDAGVGRMMAAFAHAGDFAGAAAGRWGGPN